MSSGDELFARIAADPDDDGNYLVYADWLEGQGDPQGELIVLHHQLERATAEADRARLGAALGAYLTKHRKRLFGDLAGHAGIAWDFHLGFLRGIRVVPDIREDREALVGRLLALPIARILRELVVFEQWVNHQAELERAVAAHRPATLAGVTFARRYTELEAAVADGDAVTWFELPYGLDAVPRELLALRNLELLSISRTQVRAIPPQIAKLARLRRLEISWCNELEDLPQELFGIETLSYVEMWECFGLRDAYHMGRVNALLAGFARARTPSRRRIIETNLMLARDQRAFAAASTADLLAALDNNMAAVRESAVRGLAKALPEPPPIAGGTLALAGKTNFDKATLARNLKGLGATLAPKLTGATTHVIVGEEPGGKQMLVGDLPVIVEPHLVAWFAAKPANAKPAGELRDALRGDDATATAAIAALEGTVPDRLLAELVAIAMDLKLDKARAAAKKLLAVAAPASVTAAMKTHLKQSLFLDSMGETKRGDRITAFCAAAKVIDRVELARILFARGRVALRYVVDHGQPADIAAALASRVVDGALDLTFRELVVAPEELATLELAELDLSANHLRGWPAVVEKIAGLVRLDVSHNAIAKLPDSAAHLRLAKLSIESNRLRAFPPAVLAMTSLVELDISSQRDAGFTLPDDLGRLANLERLSVGGHDLSRPPPSLFSLVHLAHLDLRFCTVPLPIPHELERLTALRELHVASTAWQTRAAELRALLPSCEIVVR